jgi:hypothetical protein
LDSNFARAELLPVFNKGNSINAAADKEDDNMVFINFGTDTGFGFLNGLKHKNIIRFQKIQGETVFIFHYLWEILAMIYGQ